MCPINLRSIVIANNGLPPELKEALFRVWGIAPKPEELYSLDSFIKSCDALAPKNPETITTLLEDCYLNFSIPRISKEFDCLWISERAIINVELKSSNTGTEKIKNQLLKNRYYLRHLKRDIISFTYEASTGYCYALDDNEDLTNVLIIDVVKALYNLHKEPLYREDIEGLFPPEQFLVSPFNSPKSFLKDYYFLTDRQQEIKNKIIKFLNNPAEGYICSLTGGPGSGKTLLMYDIAKTLTTLGKDVLICHAGGLNDGQKTLVEAGWRIKSTKNIFGNYDFEKQTAEIEDADVYMIDEAQRCYPIHLENIIGDVNKNGKKCLISFDREQVMSNAELRYDNGNKIKTLCGDNCFSLTSNIRTNAVVYEFVRALFDMNKSVNKHKKGSIEIAYCQNTGEAITMLSILKSKGFHIPKFTPRLHGVEDYEAWFPGDEQSAHEVIGQEFDNVVGLVSENLAYNKDGKLVSSGNYYYNEERMLYQILSRARKKIHLVVVNNPLVLKRCLRLLGSD